MKNFMYHFPAEGKIELEGEADLSKYKDIGEKERGVSRILFENLRSDYFCDNDNKPMYDMLDSASIDMDENGYVRAVNVYLTDKVDDDDKFKRTVEENLDRACIWTGADISMNGEMFVFDDLMDRSGLLTNKNGDPFINADGEPLFDNLKDQLAYLEEHPHLTDIDEMDENEFWASKEGDDLAKAVMELSAADNGMRME